LQFHVPRSPYLDRSPFVYVYHTMVHTPLSPFSRLRHFAFALTPAVFSRFRFLSRVSFPRHCTFAHMRDFAFHAHFRLRAFTRSISFTFTSFSFVCHVFVAVDFTRYLVHVLYVYGLVTFWLRSYTTRVHGYRGCCTVTIHGCSYLILALHSCGSTSYCTLTLLPFASPPALFYFWFVHGSTWFCVWFCTLFVYLSLAHIFSLHTSFWFASWFTFSHFRSLSWIASIWVRFIFSWTLCISFAHFRLLPLFFGSLSNVLHSLPLFFFFFFSSCFRRFWFWFARSRFVASWHAHSSMVCCAFSKASRLRLDSAHLHGLHAYPSHSLLVAVSSFYTFPCGSTPYLTPRLITRFLCVLFSPRSSRLPLVRLLLGLSHLFLFFLFMVSP